MILKTGKEGDYLIYYTSYNEYTCLFPNQEKFTESLINPSQFVKINDGTPLTTCILIALEAFKNLTSEVNQNNERLDRFYTNVKNSIDPTLRNVNGNVIYSSGPTSGSAHYIAEVVLFSNPLIEQTGIKSNIYFSKGEFQGKEYYTSANCDNQFRSIIGYLQLYIFFIALGSVLDIMAQTVYKLFGLDTKNLNWGDFVENFNRIVFKNEDSIFINLLNSTNTFDRNFAKPKILFYRNRFAHDGYCQIEVKEDKNHKWILYLPRKAKSGNDFFDFNVIKECDNLLIETIKYVNYCYGLFFDKVQMNNQPPW